MTKFTPEQVEDCVHNHRAFWTHGETTVKSMFATKRCSCGKCGRHWTVRIRKDVYDPTFEQRTKERFGPGKSGS